MERYDFVKSSVFLPYLEVKIRAEQTLSSLSYILWNAPSSLSIFFSQVLTQQQYELLSQLVSDHSPQDFYQDKHQTRQNIPGNLVREAWYESVDQSNNPINLSRENIYTWKNGKVMGRSEIIYFKDGTIASQKDYQYYYDPVSKTLLIKDVTP